jgi:hypothetical protein
MSSTGVFNVVSAALAVCAAYLWWKSAKAEVKGTMRPGTTNMSGSDIDVGGVLIYATARLQSKLSGQAALFAAGAAAAQALALLLPEYSSPRT